MTDRPKPTVTEVEAEMVPAPEVAPTPAPHDERVSTDMPDAPRKMVRLTRMAVAKGGELFTGELQIGNSKYQVVDGVVDVPPWHADDARAAGYQG